MPLFVTNKSKMSTFLTPKFGTRSVDLPKMYLPSIIILDPKGCLSPTVLLIRFIRYSRNSTPDYVRFTTQSQSITIIMGHEFFGGGPVCRSFTASVLNLGPTGRNSDRRRQLTLLRRTLLLLTLCRNPPGQS